MVCLGVFCSAVAYALWAFAYSKLGASRANVYSNLIPVFTAIFSYLLAMEEMTVFKIIGIVVVVVGLVLSQMRTGDEGRRTGDKRREKKKNKKKKKCVPFGKKKIWKDPQKFDPL